MSRGTVDRLAQRATGQGWWVIEVTLDKAVTRLEALAPRRTWWRLLARRAAVAVILREGTEGLEALMIQRAERHGDRWSGHMAFPGGLRERRDGDMLATAVRETSEEIGLDLLGTTRLVAHLSDIVTPSHRGHRRPLVISPFVFSVVGPLPPLAPNYEVAGTVWVPLGYLADHSNRGEMDWPARGRSHRLAYYLYREKRIWGLSLRMLDELVQELLVETDAD